MGEGQGLGFTTIGDHKIQTAQLETVAYSALKAGEQAEAQKLLKSAQSPGFFYLDLHNEQNGNYLDSLKKLYKLGKSYFDQPESVKMADFQDGEEKGYKPGDAETLEMARDDVLKAKAGIPALLQSTESIISQFIVHSHAITKTLLAGLSSGLALPSDHDVELTHHETSSSASGLKLESVPLEERLEDVPPSEHTDGGTLTLLFCDDYTTELQLPHGGEWGFIVPKKGCAIVNVADSLDRMSEGKLTSRLHRVGQPVAGKGERVCVLYYLRPGTRSTLGE